MQSDCRLVSFSVSKKYKKLESCESQNYEHLSAIFDIRQKSEDERENLQLQHDFV